MRLTSLKLAGFKSFADSTTLTFADNRTAVVGPNGCGKSNVIDAIRWVMGESSARQLRGGAMTDVIFAGTSTRKPVGQASVELRFENTLGKLGGEYNAYSELSVRRQVNREGRSDYFLNGTRCRRRDITNIFLGTGLGPRSYAIIEQGMINRMVDAKPLELRVFIEEAAGVSRYQARRRETLQHLEHTRQNLSRLQDIDDELQSQIRSLKRQSQAAVTYRALEQQQQQLKSNIWSAHYVQAQQQQQLQTIALERLSEQYRELRSQRNQFEVDWQTGSQQLSDLLLKAEPLQQLWQQAERELNTLDAWMQHYQTELQQHDIQQQQWQHNLATLSQQVAQDQLGLEEAEQQRTVTQQQMQTSQQHLQHQLTQHAYVEQQHAQVEAIWQTTQQQVHALNQQQQGLQQQIDNSLRAQLRLEQQIGQARQQLEQLEHSSQQAELDEVLLALSELHLSKTQQEQNFQQQQIELDHQQQQLAQCQQTLKQQRIVYQQCEAELQAIEKLTTDSNHHSKHKNNKPLATAQVANSNIKLLQQLKLATQAKAHLPLLEKFMGDWLAAELQDNFSPDTSSTRSYLASDVDESILRCLDNTQVTPLQQWITPCLSCWRAVGVVADYSVASTLQAQLNSQQSLLSLDGFWLGQNWQINLNNDEQASRQKGILQQQQRQQELMQQLTQLTPLMQPVQQQVQQLEQQVIQQQIYLKDSQQQLTAFNKQQNQLDIQRARLESSLQSAQKQIQHVQQQLAQLQHDQQDDQAQIAEWQMDLAAISIKLDGLHPRLQQAQTEREQVQYLRQQSAGSLDLAQQQDRELQHTLQRLKVEIHSLAQSLQRAQPQQQQINAQLLILKQASDEAQAQHPLKLKQLHNSQQKATLAHSNWSGWQQQLDSRQQEQQRLSQLRQQGQTSEDQLRDQLEQTRLLWQQHKTDMQHATEQLEALKVSTNDAHLSVSATPEQLIAWQAQLDKVQQQLQKLGQLNLAAPEALQEVSDRHSELAQQMQDLQHTVEQLEQAMQSIDQQTRTLFMTTFDRVNAELKLLFPKVFGGGQASLSLEDDWQSGIKLMAQPPGKRNSSLALLSGGEKALTALALVFAIFRLNPAPFCVLDEVDAPLDDANVQRFCHLVKELSQQVQFIYITHNKLAMTMATDLLGVTMPEPGASRLVAVNIEQAAKYTATLE